MGGPPGVITTSSKMVFPKPYRFTGFGDMHGPKPYKFIGFGDLHGPKPYKFIGFGDLRGVASFIPSSLGVWKRVEEGGALAPLLPPLLPHTDPPPHPGRKRITVH